jgi:hypothetical protein
VSARIVDLIRSLLEALQEARPGAALEAVHRLTNELRETGADGADLGSAWDAFVGLLERRGYYVATPEELAASLDEIRSVGGGFDLYELAAGLAGYDAAAVDCLGLRERRQFPRLAPFARPCGCGRHPPRRRKESER